MFADEFLPVHDVSHEVAAVVAADPLAVWEALFAADLVEAGKRTPLAGLLGALRVLPELVSHLLHGEQPPHGPATLLRALLETIRQTAEDASAAEAEQAR